MLWLQVKCALDVHRHAKVLDKSDTARVCREAGRVEDLLNAAEGLPAGTKPRCATVALAVRYMSLFRKCSSSVRNEGLVGVFC